MWSGLQFQTHNHITERQKKNDDTIRNKHQIPQQLREVLQPVLGPPIKYQHH